MKTEFENQPPLSLFPAYHCRAQWSWAVKMDDLQRCLMDAMLLVSEWRVCSVLCLHNHGRLQRSRESHRKCFVDHAPVASDNRA
jgi:hypothetical protein